MSRCLWCNAELPPQRTGRPRRYCGDACRKQHDRAFPALPPGMRPLPDPGPLPTLSADDRFTQATTELRIIRSECVLLAHDLRSDLSWRAQHLASAIDDALTYCFGRDC